jgi:hypothetical protein
MKQTRTLAVYFLFGCACGGGAGGCSGNIGPAAADSPALATTGQSVPPQGGGSSLGSHTGTTSSSGGTSGTSSGSDGMAATDAGGGSTGLPPAPHVVSPCPSGGTAVGQWENISPSQVPSDGWYVTVAVDPHDPATVYTGVGTANAGKSYGVYKSTNCGATWVKIDTGRNSAEMDTGYQWQIQVDPSTPTTLWASNGYGQPPCLFKSTNGGVDWDPAWGTSVSSSLQYNFGQGFDLDPTDSQHIVVTFHENCQGALAPMCMGESTDGGATWRLFKGPTSGWVEAGQVTVFGPTTFIYAAPFDGLYYTSNSGATWKTVANDALGVAFTSSTGQMFLGSEQHGTLTSMDHGLTWNSIPNSPLATTFAEDNQSIYSGYQNNTSGQPFYKTSKTAPTKWSTMTSPQIGGGPSFMAYDPDHHILYSNNWANGLWRVVTY